MNWKEKIILEVELQKSLQALSKARSVRQVKHLQEKIKYLQRKLQEFG
ncbi:MAG: hypothetical protein J7L39_03990 [Candidatus Aenigmarchaeota archaeon]|nr:hypothetical protein [Candidatus Aenigmarchaeota archaeon]